MAFEMFCIEVPGGGDELKRLNDFIIHRRVVSKREQLIERGGVPYMMVWLEYVPQEEGGSGRQNGFGNGATAHRDVWETLNGEQRESFEKLRQWRQALASEEHVKPYVIFTNNQLGDMVLRQACSVAALKEIADVGEQRLKKYGYKLLPMLKEMFGKTSDENSPETASSSEAVPNGGEADVE